MRSRAAGAALLAGVLVMTGCARAADAPARERGVQIVLLGGMTLSKPLKTGGSRAERYRQLRPELMRVYELFKGPEMLREKTLILTSLYAPLGGKRSARPELAEMLRMAGIDAVSLAGGVMTAAGPEAAAETRRKLEDAGLSVVGVGGKKGGPLLTEPVIFDRGGVRIAAAGFAVDLLPAQASRRMASSRDPDAVLVAGRRVIEHARDGGADIVVLLVGWFDGRPSEERRHLARALIDAGADVVAVHHPGDFEGIEARGRGWIIHNPGQALVATGREEPRSSFAFRLHVVDGRLSWGEAQPMTVDAAMGETRIGRGAHETHQVVERLAELSGAFGTRLANEYGRGIWQADGAPLRDVRQGEAVIDPWVGTGPTRVLVDMSHQWEGRPDFVLDETEFRYSHSQSTSRLMTNLVRQGFRYRQIREPGLTYPVLKQHDVVFLNVPTFREGGRSKPDRPFRLYSKEEAAVLERFVRDGGGLFVVAEHNNAYDNARSLNPILERFGVRVPPAYALDKPLSPYTVSDHTYLIRIRHYEPHPVTRGVRVTSWLGGTPLETDHGVAFLSEHGHADLGDFITLKPSRFSNRRVDPGEKHGPGIPLVAALEHGRGRVVVIGDHNALGVQWIGIGDNYRLAMNAFEWLAKRENEKTPLAEHRPAGLRLGFDLEHTDWNVGLRDRRGFHPAFVNFSRHPDVFPMGLLDLSDPSDALVLLEPVQTYSRREIDAIRARLDRGQTALLVMDIGEPQKGSAQLVQEFLPDLIIRAGDRLIRAADIPDIPPSSLPWHRGTLPVYSETLDLDGIEAAALKPRHYSGRGIRRVPVSLEKAVPYLWKVRVDAGEPFIDARGADGGSYTIARRFAVGRGSLILFLQGKMWSNETFGTMRDEPVQDAAYGAHDIQMAVLRWLAENAPREDV